MEGKKFFATGRRKTSVARVWMEPGNGAITINTRSIDDFFGGLEFKKAEVRQPLELCGVGDKYNVHINVQGGGITGQAQAIRHGIARTLTIIDETMRGTLKGAFLLTRDPRKVERKKYGLKKARKRFQFSKR
jgi:small subunit ribosomal protein S9